VQGDQRGLERERPILLVGIADGAPASERAFLNNAVYDAATDTTRLTFLDPLQHTYDRDTLAIYANVVEATHGETVREILGSGDASQPFQAFVLQKQPVTYIPEAGAPNGAGSTLEIRVNDVKWEEVRSFYGQDGARAVYTTRTDDDGAVTVRFGDGVTGQRLPTGRGNVTAVYRYGIGSVGNLRAGTLKTLLDRPLGVKSVINPLPSEGGAEAERAEDIRANAPNTVRTFGRIVSLRDFEDAAREYAGVAKARAAIEWDGEDQQVRLTVAGDNGADILPGGSTYSALLDDLNRRRDPNRRLILSNYRKFGVVVAAKLIIDTPTYIPERVIDAVETALKAYFAFDNRDLGRSVYLSDLYRVIHDVKGVEAVDVDAFRPAVPPPPPPRRPPPRRPLIYEAIDVESDQLIALDALTLIEMQEPNR
jgi:predicted phage baseplate assembly protein